jgi:hypothetical protein
MSTKVEEEIDSEVFASFEDETICQIEWTEEGTDKFVSCEQPAKYSITFWAHKPENLRTKLACVGCVASIQIHEEICNKCSLQTPVVKNLNRL